MNKLIPGLISLYAAVFLLSLNGLFAKLIPLEATALTQLRSSIAVVFFLLLCRVRKRRLRLDGWTQYAGLYTLGLLLGLHWAAFFHAMQRSNVAVGMLSLYSFPMMTILLEPWFSKERLRGQDMLAGLTVLAGLAVMLAAEFSNGTGSVAAGVFWGVFRPCCFQSATCCRNIAMPECRVTV